MTRRRDDTAHSADYIASTQAHPSQARLSNTSFVKRTLEHASIVGSARHEPTPRLRRILASRCERGRAIRRLLSVPSHVLFDGMLILRWSMVILRALAAKDAEPKLQEPDKICVDGSRLEQ